MNPMNSITTFLVGTAGLNMQGAMVLTVRGRKSGEPRSLVVNPLELNGKYYLMSPRGETQWVKNLRANHNLTLHRGANRAGYVATEVTDAEEKFEVLRAYLDRWNWQVKSLMSVSKASSDEELRAAVGSHPVLILQPAK